MARFTAYYSNDLFIVKSAFEAVAHPKSVLAVELIDALMAKQRAEGEFELVDGARMHFDFAYLMHFVRFPPEGVELDVDAVQQLTTLYDACVREVDSRRGYQQAEAAASAPSAMGPASFYASSYDLVAGGEGEALAVGGVVHGAVGIPAAVSPSAFFGIAGEVGRGPVSPLSNVESLVTQLKRAAAMARDTSANVDEAVKARIIDLETREGADTAELNQAILTFIEERPEALSGACQEALFLRALPREEAFGYK